MKTKRGCSRALVICLAILGGLCLLWVGGVQIINARQPVESQVSEQLSALDKVRLAEAVHQRQLLGEQVLPGWSQAQIALIVYNEQYLFLVDLPENPGEKLPVGWRKVPEGSAQGQAWEPAPDGDFYGRVYYRQPIAASGKTSQAFTVQVGDHWAASLTTLDWMKILLGRQLRDDLPDPLDALLPYPLLVRVLVPNSDSYISLVQHEAVHAYQGLRAPQRLAAGEQAAKQFSQLYPWDNAGLQADWQTELDLLHDALRAETPAETLRLARAFLQQRQQRRSAAQLSDKLMGYERQREWVEGIAKYGEREIYRLAGQPGYQALPEMNNDPEFQRYQGGQQKWDNEVDQMTRTAGDEGDGRFYYTGFAQAVLLDRLAPGWKEQLFEDGIWLEDLLAQVVREE